MPENNQMLERPQSIAALRQIRRDLCELARPFVDLKCEILARTLPSIILYPDGRIETIYHHETVTALAEVDSAWQAEINHVLARTNRGLYGK